jgi:hypothetical protein
MTDSPPPRIMLTPEQAKARRARNIAIALAVGFLVVVFYAVTIIKLGSAVFQKGG